MSVQSTPVPVTEEPPPEENDPWVGSTLDGRYAIEAKLGEGGIGRVYRARHLKLGRPVAVKVLLERFRTLESVKARFEREAQTLSALQHPNIVTVTDYGLVDGCPYLVMELIEGEDLDVLLEEVGAIPVERALGLMVQVLRSLAYAHESGIVHRDLKPGNALLRVLPDGSDHVEVLDFGLAKFLDDGPADGTKRTSPKLTRAGTVLGTPAYMAPEQVEASACDARTDVYAAGVMLFELLTGQLPFQHEDPGSMLRAHLVDTPPTLRSVRPELPAALEPIVAKALAKRQEERYRDGAEMLHALEHVELHARPSLEAVTGKLKVLRDELPEKLEKASAQVSEVSKQAGEKLGRLRQRAEALRTKLPEPIQKIPPTAFLALGGLLVVGVLAAGVAIILSMVDRPAVVTPVAQVHLAELPEGVALEDVEQTAALPAPRDPWEDEDMPGEMRPIRARVLEGRRLGRSMLGTLRMLHRDYPQDCRPLLLHAHAYADKRWLSHALPLYVEVFELDPSCRGDPLMLDHMVEMTMTETLHHEASGTLLQIYGDEAEDAIEAKLDGDVRPAERQRLEAVLDAL